MKTFLVIIAALFSFSAFSQTTMPPDSAKNHIGSTATICGSVKGAFSTKSGVTFLNFGKSYPDQTFTAVISDSLSMNVLFNTDSLKGKNVCVTGTIVEYKGKPEMKISSKDQLKVQ